MPSQTHIEPASPTRHRLAILGSLALLLIGLLILLLTLPSPVSSWFKSQVGFGASASASPNALQTPEVTASGSDEVNGSAQNAPIDSGGEVIQDGQAVFDPSSLATYIGDDGITVYDRGQGYIDMVEDPTNPGSTLYYGQSLAHAFTEEESQCSLVPEGDSYIKDSYQWSIPSIGAATKFTATNWSLPAYPDAEGRYGSWKSDTAPIGSSSGASFLGGHLNHSPGVYSAIGGEASAWGLLHQIQPCAHLYISNESAQQLEYVAVSATEYDMRVNPTAISSNPEYWRYNGDPAIYFITCAGVGGMGDDGQTGVAGSTLLGTFTKRIVIKFVPVNA